MAQADTDATVSSRLPTPGAAAARESARGRPFGLLGSAAWTLGCIGVLTAVVWSRHPEIFTNPMYAGGDEGVNSLLVIRAEHFSQLTGNYSRVGFHHPGAALIYMLTAGEVVFHNLLHVAPSFYNAQILGVTVYSITLLVLTGGALGRVARSRWVGTVVVAAGFLFMSVFPWLSSVWFPYLYAPAFLAFSVAAALVAAGRTRDLPLAVLAGGILVHGHVSFVLFVGVTGAVAVVAWWFAHRRHVREEARRARTSLLVSLGLAGLFLLPLVLQSVRNFPGPWPAYLDFGATGERDPRSIGDAVGFVLRYWTETPWPAWLYVVAAVVLVVAALLVRDRQARLAYAWLLGAVVLQTALAVVYAYKGVDLLDQRYIEEFYKTVPLVVVLGALTAAGSLLVVDAHGAPVRVVVAAAVDRHGHRGGPGAGDGLPAAGWPHLPGGRRRAPGQPVAGRAAGRDPARRTYRVARRRRAGCAAGPDGRAVVRRPRHRAGSPALHSPERLPRGRSRVEPHGLHAAADVRNDDLERGDGLRADVALPLA